MRTSTEISADDHRDFIQSLSGDGVEEAKAREGARALSRPGSMYLSVAVFFGVFVWVMYRMGVDGLLDRPFLSILAFTGFLLVPAAIACLTSARRLREDLEDIADGNIIDQNALRKGLNIGEAHFTWDPNGVTVGLAFVRSSYSWSAFQELKETSTAFHLMIDDHSGLILPKRAFSDDSMRQDFQTFVAEHIGAGE